MLFERFKNIIEEFNSNLLDNINREREKSFAIQKEIIDQLFVNKDNAIKTLQDLETNYARKSMTKQTQINSLNHKISQLRDELNKTVLDFQVQHDLQPLKQKLMNAKENKLSGLKQLKKKEINDLTAKINALDKECLLILKEKDNAILETEKNNRAKIADFERRMKLEVLKINESILTPVPTIAGKTAEELEDNSFSKQKVKEIRKNGINEIADLKLHYLDATFKEKLSFNKVRIQNEHDSQITREEYNLKIAELKYEREKHKRELELAQDAYDFDTYIIVNDTKKQKLLEEKAIVNDYNLRMYQHSDTINRIEVKRDISNGQINNQFLDLVNENEGIQGNKFSELNKKNIESFQQTIIYVHEYIDKVILSLSEMLIGVINNFWNNYYETEKQFTSSMIIVSYNITELKDLSYQSSIKAINEMQDKYQKLQEMRYKKLMIAINNNVKMIHNAISTYIDTINDYIKNEVSAASLYNNDLKRLVINGYTKNKENYNLININDSKKTNQMIENKKKTRDQEINGLKAGINQINEDHLAEYKDISDKKKNYDKEFSAKEKQILIEHQNYMASVKKNIEHIKKKYNYELKTTQNELAKTNAEEIKDIELERKTKLKIGQI